MGGRGGRAGAKRASPQPMGGGHEIHGGGEPRFREVVACHRLPRFGLGEELLRTG